MSTNRRIVRSDDGITFEPVSRTYTLEEILVPVHDEPKMQAARIDNIVKFPVSSEAVKRLLVITDQRLEDARKRGGKANQKLIYSLEDTRQEFARLLEEQGE